MNISPLPMILSGIWEMDTRDMKRDVKRTRRIKTGMVVCLVSIMLLPSILQEYLPSQPFSPVLWKLEMSHPLQEANQLGI